jgi:hypothetical protein
MPLRPQVRNAKQSKNGVEKRMSNTSYEKKMFEMVEICENCRHRKKLKFKIKS